MNTNQLYFKVAVDAPLEQSLTYSPLEDDKVDLKRGQPVIVPLGKRSVKALVTGTTEEAGEYKLKPISQIDETRPRLNEKFLSWLEWLSDYYIYPIGQVIELAFPPLKKGGRARKKEVVPHLEISKPPPLSHEQTQVFQSIDGKKDFGVHLVHGVTGSGKTEVYLHLLEKV